VAPGLRSEGACDRATREGDAEVPSDTKGDAVKIDDWLLEILVCPKCHSPVRVDEEASELVCTGADCGLAYPVRDDIPVMLVDEARDPAKG